MKNGKLYVYPAKVTKGDLGDSIVEFRDVPEAATQVEKDEELQTLAADALITLFSDYMETDELIPTASQPKKGEVLVELPLSFVAKIILHNAMLENRYRPVDIAKSMGIPTSEVARITNPKHKTKIDTIAAAIKAAGGRMELVSI